MRDSKAEQLLSKIKITKKNLNFIVDVLDAKTVKEIKFVKKKRQMIK